MEKRIFPDMTISSTTKRRFEVVFETVPLSFAPNLLVSVELKKITAATARWTEPIWKVEKKPSVIARGDEIRP